MRMDDFMTHDFYITKVSALHIKGCTKSKPQNNRPEYGLVFYPEGGYIFHFSDGTVVRTGKNTILFNPKGSAYTIECCESHDCCSITFDLAENFECEPFAVSVRDARFFLDTFKETEKIYRQAQSGYMMNCKSRLCSIIAAMQREYSLGYISGENYSVITPATDMIHRCYTGVTPSVPELAALCGISPEYFRMLFKKKHGASPVKYINSLRLDRARELLSAGVYTVTEVAAMSGFSELPYFCREFKKKYGISPSEYLN